MLARLLTINPLFLAIGLAVLMAGAFGTGWEVRSWRCDAALLEAERATAKARAALQEAVDEAATAYEQDRSEGHAASYARQETIRTIYKDRVVSPDCAVLDDARSVLVEAIDATHPAAPGQSRR